QILISFKAQRQAYRCPSNLVAELRLTLHYGSSVGGERAESTFRALTSPLIGAANVISPMVAHQPNGNRLGSHHCRTRCVRLRVPVVSLGLRDLRSRRPRLVAT